MKKINDIKLICGIVIIISLIIRVSYLFVMSGDYINFLKPWVEQIKELNGFYSLRENIGNYNIPYMIILTIISYFKCAPLVPIKIVSIIFDFVCAIASYKIIYKITEDKEKACLSGALITLLPTVIINGSMWGQCDSIYCAFVLFSIYFLLDKKYITSFIMLGIAFAFKIQTLFILPLFVLLLFREKKIKWYYFLFIPLVNFVLCLPAIIGGRKVLDVLTIYFNQMEYYEKLVMNFPNIYVILEKFKFTINYSNIITLLGIGSTLIIFFAVWVLVIIKKVDFNFEKTIAIGIWSIMIATFFLPRMHDRYMFVADILSIIWFVIYKKKAIVPVAVNTVSLITYLSYLMIGPIDYTILACVYAIVIVYFTIYVIKLLIDKNADDTNFIIENITAKH